jgi:hypothetical protein
LSYLGCAQNKSSRTTDAWEPVDHQTKKYHAPAFVSNHDTALTVQEALDAIPFQNGDSVDGCLLCLSI